ncbi:hypothetical protein KEH51_09325 [[Brevibacterium] frigoritolerans]|uniref:Tyr recombinase domain-containing protein n=1 Tax=Peribacillus frigoritolerans TaxID=450367 RepID=A0A941J2G9_9BACI|nr:hypothetical protein [Peribacillus frigoritolerans]
MISMDVSDVHASMGFVRCVGKGNKERIIPIGQTALGAIEHYLESSREMASPKQRTDSLF